MVDSEERPIRLAIQSGQRQARRALADHLADQPHIDVVGDTSTLSGLSALCALCRPDVCLVEGGSATDLAVDQLRELRDAFPDIDFVVTYSSVDAVPTLTDAAVRAGAAALVATANDTATAADTGTVLRAVRERRAAVARPLTDRELSVVSLMGAGRSAADIARLLHISPHTVETHKRGLYAKFGVGNQSHAVSRAISLGLVDDAAPACDAARPDPGHPFVVVVRGPAGGCRDEVIVALLEGQIPFAVSESPHSMTHDHWARWHRGGLVSLLVDPDPDAWRDAVQAVVVHSAPPEAVQTVDAVLHGACALLSRADIGPDLCHVLALAARGYRTLNSSHVRLLATWISALMSRPRPSVFELTSRERDILASIACGHTVRQTAQALGIATKTVENTQTRLFRKLGTHNRSETVLAAYRLGMVAWPQDQ
jgi:two-component system nitrate/nitrite response regulator NarL